MKAFIIAVLVLAIEVSSFSQDKSKIKEYFLEAEYYLMYEDYAEALPFYLRIDYTSFTNFNIKYRIGLCYLHTGFSKDKSIKYFEEAVQGVSKKYNEGSIKQIEAPVDAYYFLAKAYRINNQLEKAIEYYNIYSLTLDEKDVASIYYLNEEISSCENAKSIKINPVRVDYTNVNAPINNRFSNFNPVISNDENMLIFISKQKFYDAIFQSNKIDDKWTAPMNITSQIGSDGNFSPTSISFDKKSLLLYKDDLFGGDIYLSKYNDTLLSWSAPVKLSKNINSKSWETHACFSADGKTIYFTSNRSTGFGGMDIYKSTLNDDKEWGEAINLGSAINTVRNEETPYITKDGKTIFFSSQGHHNMGGFDIFYSKLAENNIWSKPINIGYPINTTDDNKFLNPAKNGKVAYQAKQSNRGLLISDIYRLEFVNEEISPNIKVIGSIKLQDNSSEFLNIFSVKIESLDRPDEIIDNINIDYKGIYSLNLPRGNYKFTISGEGYKDKIENVIISKKLVIEEITINSELIPKNVSSGEYAIIKSIYFNFDDLNLTREARIELEKLLIVMKNYPEMKIEIIGYSDSIGSSKYNLFLSEKRAQIVADYMLKKGVNENRFIVTGQGEKSPIALNLKEGRQYNRRTDIRVLNAGSNNKIISQLCFLYEHLSLVEKEVFHIIISDQPNKISKKQISLLKNINIDFSHKDLDNIHLYYFGTFEEKSEALIIYNNIISAGFTEAKIISNKEFIDIYE